MDFQSLLRPFVCSCGREHSCQIQNIVIRPGALDCIGGLVENFAHILLVADRNTYEAAGQPVEKQLNRKVENRVIFSGDGFLVPDEAAVAVLAEQVTEKTDLIMGIGSGVIQDLCKYVSFQRNLPYDIVATAPSMDGYASKGAAMIFGNMKITETAHVPRSIVGDVDILRQAPLDMLRSGYGDILGKFSCLNDWKLGRIVNGEYVCQHVYDMTWQMLQRTKDLGSQLQKRDPEAVQILMEALVGIGIAMAYVGNSRPGSGSEHHLSHFFEVTGLVHGEPYLIHGTDVAYSAVYTQRLRETLLQLEDPGVPQPWDRTKWETEICRIYGQAAQGVIDLQDRLGWHRENRLPRYRAVWNDILEVLREPPSSSQMEAYLQTVGFDLSEFQTLYGEEKISDAICYAMDLKDRYSVLWLYNDLFPQT